MARKTSGAAPTKQAVLLAVGSIALIAIAATVVLVLTGGSKTPPDAVAYGTVEQLHQAAVKAGYSCPAWKQDDAVKLAAESGHCSDSDVFATFAGQDDLQLQLDGQKGTDQSLTDAGIEPGVTLVGPNWLINGPDQQVRALQAGLGGTIIDHQS